MRHPNPHRLSDNSHHTWIEVYLPTSAYGTSSLLHFPIFACRSGIYVAGCSTLLSEIIVNINIRRTNNNGGPMESNRPKDSRPR